MRILILIVSFLLIASIAYASNVVICRTSNDDSKQIIRYLKSVHTPRYSSDNKNLINPDVSLLINVPTKYWKCVNSGVVEMTPPEKALVDLDEADVINQELMTMVDNWEANPSDMLRAFIKVYNSKAPVVQEITEQELIDQIKTDLGL